MTFGEHLPPSTIEELKALAARSVLSTVGSLAPRLNAAAAVGNVYAKAITDALAFEELKAATALLEDNPPLPEHPTPDEAALALEDLEPVTIEELNS